MAIGLRLLATADALWTPAELRDLARLAGDQSNASIAELLAQATAFVERRTSRSLLRQQWRQTFDGFPSGTGDVSLRLYRAPVVAEGLVEYLDPTTFEWVEFESVWWSVESEPATLSPTSGESWPTVAALPGCVRVDFYAGYGTDTADVPADLRRAVLTVASHWYEHPEAVITGTISTELQQGLQDILDSYWYCGEAS